MAEWLMANKEIVMIVAAIAAFVWYNKGGGKDKLSSATSDVSTKLQELKSSAASNASQLQSSIEGTDIASFLNEVKDDVEKTAMVNLLLRLRHKYSSIPDQADRQSALDSIQNLMQVTTKMPKDAVAQ